MPQFLLILFWLASPFLYGQRPPLPQTDALESISFEHYGQTEGLSQGTINDMLSYDGFMWFATQDGLNRFDGVEFKVFRKSASVGLADNLVQALLADSKGRLWVGTGGGISLFDQKTGQFRSFQAVFGLKHPVGQTPIHRFFEDPKGCIWIITNELGLFCFNPRTKIVQSFFPNDKTIQGGCVARDGRIWVSSLNDVFRLDSQTGIFRPLQIRKQARTQSLIRTILLDKQENLWVATSDDGAFKLKKDEVTHYQQGNTNKHLSSNDVATMLCDQTGRVWLGTRSGGISLYNPNTQQFSYIRHSRTNTRSLAEDFVWQLYQDQQGIVWVGNSSQGIDKYDPHRFPFGLIGQTAGDVQQSLPDNMIFRLFGQGDDLYIGTETGGLARYSVITRQLRAFPPIRPPEGSALRDETRVIVADSDRKLWFANWRELTQYDPIKRVVRAYPVHGPRKQMYAFGAHVLNDSTGQSTEIWVGGHAGLTRFDLQTKQWKSWQDHPNLQPVAGFNIRLMYQQSPGIIWLGTLHNGLIGYNLHTKKTLIFSPKYSLSCLNIRSLLQVNQTLWVGTDCGLYQLDLAIMQVVRHYTKANGLPNEVIYGILPGDKGELWLSSNQGLTRFSPKLAKAIKNYDVSDGLQSNEFNTNVCYKHPNGTLFFGGVNGITYFKTSALRLNKFVPPVRITGLSVLDSAYNPTLPHLTLAPDQNFIAFSFAALNFSNAQKNQYQYRLEGIDPDWVRAGYRRTANYTNLPPGDYVFRVKGSNDDGVWNEQGASVTITINPPFWATAWFRLLLIALLLGGAYGLYRYRVEQLKSQQAHDMAVTVRTQELERHRFAKELHDGVGANLSVLNLYLSSLGSPQMPLQDVKDRSIAVLKASMEDIRSLINDMHPRSLTEQGLAQTIADMVELLNQSKQLTIDYEAKNSSDTLSEAIEINLFRVVQELLQNALKHAGASHVRLRLHTEANQLHLAYHDNGRGLDPALLDAPTGNGLVNIRQRITLLKGHCGFESVTGQGTTVTISVPFA